MDLFLFNILYSISHRVELIDLAVIFFADYLGYAVVFILGWVLIKEKRTAERIYQGSYIALTVILARGVIAGLIHLIYTKPRPFVALEHVVPLVNHTTTAFPSGHATVLFAIAFAVYGIHKKTGLWCLGIAAIVGLARVIAGAHWPLDIAGGIAVALISVFVIKGTLPHKT